MATYGKYQVYYEKIKTEVEKIREENGYLNLSKAFAHWYLKNTLKMDEQDIAETIIDGNGDNGIDAIYSSRCRNDVISIQISRQRKKY